MSLVLALPSKGRLQEQVTTFFADCGLAVSQDGAERAYAARIAAAPDVEVRLISASEIARALAAGDVHVGVTGADLIGEVDPGAEHVVAARALGFGGADLVVAVPEAWLDVADMADLAAIAAEHRMRTGKRLRVATKYLVQTRTFFGARGIDDYLLVESLGATEGAPAAGVAEAIVDITTTGATLAANRLKILADGLILKSEAQLAASRRAPWSEAALSAFGTLLDAIEARARARRVHRLDVPLGESADAAALVAVAARFGADAGARAAGGRLILYCPRAKSAELATALLAHASGPIASFSPDFVFDSPNPTFEAFKARLRG
jgi:ATP phosphoribosyltransferase